VTVAWFNKSDEGEAPMMNGHSSGRSNADAAAPRPEPREPRTLPPASAQRNAAERAIEARPIEFRAPEVVKPAAPAQRASVLGSSLRFRGELSAHEDLIVQGSVEGSITHTQSLTIGTDGSMKGDIRARIIVIDGTVEGNLYATESVSIRATAKVKGNVFAPRVGITEGAFFQGQIDMQPSAAASHEQGARLRQTASSATPLGEEAVDQLLRA